jgi:IS5 family transposase
LFQRFVSFDNDIDKINRWVVFADEIPWVEIEEKHSDLFMQGGNPAFSTRVGLGSLIIKEKRNITDEETEARIAENPYLQYFLGYSQNIMRRPFEPGSVTHFRKRFNAEIIVEINEMLFLKTQESEKMDDGSPPYD